MSKLAETVLGASIRRQAVLENQQQILTSPFR
ncbi:hypothetical protein JOC33_002651 [Thalassobacillus pellis]|nr:hypothetical protein [Thalassobacillus pellis]